MLHNANPRTERARLARILCVITLLLTSHGAIAEMSDWAEGAPGKSTGASRDYYNSAAKLKWRNFMGDWRDAKNVAQGDTAYSSAMIVDDDTSRRVEWDVTSLVQEWQNGVHPGQGIFLRAVDKGGPIIFSSREHSEASQRPRLILVGEHGTAELAANADTYLTKSTYRSLGTAAELRVSSGPDHILIRFDPIPTEKLGRLSKATLRLYTTKQYGSVRVGAFRCEQGHHLPPSDPIPGLAAKYPDDQGIGKHPDVIFATGFEAENWHEEWTQAAERKVIEPVASDAPLKFEPLRGKALRVKIAEGANGALNTLYKFKNETGTEPEEIFFRYYLRLGETWNQTLQGGKMPGISGTYGIAGWGGRKSHGTDGWSARGLFDQSLPAGNPLGGLHPIGTYCYHADMPGTYGENWGWHLGYRGFLERNRWYCVEQFLELNTPGKKDGVLRAWVDGRLAFEKTDIRFRHVEKLRIEQVWMNVYHGGKLPSPHDQHLFIDNVVIARKYIGPLGRPVSPPKKPNAP